MIIPNLSSWDWLGSGIQFPEKSLDIPLFADLWDQEQGKIFGIKQGFGGTSWDFRILNPSWDFLILFPNFGRIPSPGNFSEGLGASQDFSPSNPRFQGIFASNISLLFPPLFFLILGVFWEFFSATRILFFSSFFFLLCLLQPG